MAAGAGPKARVVALRARMGRAAADRMIDDKKAEVFGGALRRPRREDVDVVSVGLLYEGFLRVSARYTADYYRRAVHHIRVDAAVSEVVVAGAAFPAERRSGIARALSGGRGGRRVDLPLEERVRVEAEETAHYGPHGREVEFPYKLGADRVEAYPRRALDAAAVVRPPGMSVGDALAALEARMRRMPEADVRDLREEFEPTEAVEAYVPVYEARLAGPRKRAGLLRIDAVRRRAL